MLDLGALEEVSIGLGEPLKLPINLVIEDPSQPRQEFPEGPLKELAEDIKERGVKSPVSVKPINADGYYVLNAGARRLRAAIMAGLTQIPAFIDHDFNDYDQVNENEQRASLTPMELAMFIQKRLDAGDKAAEIARKLRKDRSEITYLKALLDLPECLMSLYRSERCTVARQLYDLKNLYDRSPEIVGKWCALEEQEVTRKSIAELKGMIEESRPVPPVAPAAAKEEPSLPPVVESLKSSLNGMLRELDASGESPKLPSQVASSESPLSEPQGAEKVLTSEGPGKVKKPVLKVMHGKKRATLILDRRPETEGHLYIRYEDAKGDDAIVEVVAATLKIDRLLDASQK